MFNRMTLGGAAALVALIAAGVVARAGAGDRLILDPAPSAAGPTSSGKGSTNGSGASTDDIDQRVHDLEAQKADVDHKARTGVTLDISGSVSGQVESVKK